MNVDPEYLRFTTIQASTGAPRQPVRRVPTMNLHQMLTGSSYYSVSSNALYYEVLDMPLSELETKKLIKLVYLPEGVAKEEPFEALVPKAGTLADTEPTIRKLFKLDDDKMGRLRFFQAHAGKWHKELPLTHSVAGIQDYMPLFVEIIPDEEWDIMQGNAEDEGRLIEAFHFQKEPSKVHAQGVPFRFLVKKVSRVVVWHLRIRG